MGALPEPYVLATLSLSHDIDNITNKEREHGTNF